MASSDVQEAVDNLREALIAEGMDEATADAKLAAVNPLQTNIVGNLADLHRVGALVADEETDNADVLNEAIAVPAEAALAASQGDGTGSGAPGAGGGSDNGGLNSLTKAELQERADAAGIETSSSMTKAELVAALEG